MNPEPQPNTPRTRTDAEMAELFLPKTLVVLVELGKVVRRILKQVELEGRVTVQDGNMIPMP
jgi:hypothetical protein